MGMDTEKKLAELAARIRSIAQNGLVYSLSEYDTERYTELLELSHEVCGLATGCDTETIKGCFGVQEDYVTPKVDVRAVVFDEEGGILLVREKMDGLWSLPGGWADIGYSPREVAVKEVKEETGLDVEPVRLLALLDKKSHNHPPALHYAYKVFILCRVTGGGFTQAFDILDKGFFRRDALPPLSVERVVKEQIDLMYAYRDDPAKQAVVD